MFVGAKSNIFTISSAETSIGLVYDFHPLYPLANQQSQPEKNPFLVVSLIFQPQGRDVNLPDGTG